MTDTLTRAQRSHRMSLVRGKNTKPELLVRSLIHRMGYRFRLHRRDLPGTPDLVFPFHRAVIFVHGCYWHRHSDPTCPLARLPKSRLDFWLPKLTANAVRDYGNQVKLAAAGWRVLVLWECQIKRKSFPEHQIESFLTQ